MLPDEIRAHCAFMSETNAIIPVGCQHHFVKASPTTTTSTTTTKTTQDPYAHSV